MQGKNRENYPSILVGTPATSSLLSKSALSVISTNLEPSKGIRGGRKVPSDGKLKCILIKYLKTQS